MYNFSLELDPRIERSGLQKLDEVEGSCMGDAMPTLTAEIFKARETHIRIEELHPVLVHYTPAAVMLAEAYARRVDDKPRAAVMRSCRWAHIRDDQMALGVLEDPAIEEWQIGIVFRYLLPGCGPGSLGGGLAPARSVIASLQLRHGEPAQGL